MLARPDEPKLTTGEILDRSGIASEPFGFLSEQLVLRARPANRLLEHLELLTLLHRLEQPFFTYERIHEDDAADEQQRVLNRPPSPAMCGSGTRAKSGRSLFHG